MISNWQKRLISDWVLVLVYGIRSNQRMDLVDMSVMTHLRSNGFAESLRVTAPLADLLSLLARLAVIHKRSTYFLADINRQALNFCPCKTEEDWQYLQHLLNTYYSNPNGNQITTP